MLVEGYEKADQGAGAVTADTWFHFGMTWPGNGTHFDIYIDGVYRDTSTFSKWSYRFPKFGLPLAFRGWKLGWW